MHEERNGQQENFSPHNAILPQVNALFEQLNPQDVEQFYREYQLWATQRHIAQLNAQIVELQQQRNQNAECMQRIQPSSIALSVLAQLQVHGVEDVDLLDRMLERGDEWLDHTMDLLTRCEAMDMIQGDYTRWCEHALEGAYDWIDSMTQAQAWPEEPATTDETTIEETEALLLHKLMSDGETQPGLVSVVASPPSENEPIQEHNLTTLDEPAAPDEEEMQPEMGTTIEFALDEQPAAEAAETTAVRGRITGPLPPRITGPLQAEEEETTSQAQEEPEAVVVDEVETTTTSENEDEIAPQAQVEAEAVQQPEDDATVQIQDEAETISIPEDNLISQTQPEDVEVVQQPEDAEAAPPLEDEAPALAQDETAAQGETPASTQDETSIEDEAPAQVQDETVIQDETSIQDEAPAQAQDETVVAEHISDELSAEHPTETLRVVRGKAKAAPLDNIVEDQPQEEATQPLDEHPTLDLPHNEERTQTNEDELTSPLIDEQQSPAPINDQQSSPEPVNEQSQLPEQANELQQSESVNDQPQQQPEAINNHQEPLPEPINSQSQQPEATLTPTTAGSHSKVFTTDQAPPEKKKRRGLFSWLFRRKS